MTAEPPLDVARGAEENEEVLATTQLQVRALGLTGALMQNITAIAPAITAFFFTATIVGFTGAISPFAYFLGFLIVLALGLCLVQLAKLFPSDPTPPANKISPLLSIVAVWARRGVLRLPVTRKPGVTLRLVALLMTPEDASMVVDPRPTAAAKPAALMVAGLSDEVQVTVLVRFCVLPSVKVPVAENCCPVPNAIDAFSGVRAMETSAGVVTVKVAEP